MSKSKLFDYNSSFSVIRTNPKLTGNFKISVDSTGGVWFNSMDVNNTLSNDIFKKYNISGQNSYATDVSSFFAQGKISNDIIFQVGKFTSGEVEAAQYFSDQYDFFYGAGASSLIDKNYPEEFSYFAPLWIKSEIPDFFVIFKLDNPLDYPYSKNVTVIENGKKYKVIQDFDSSEDFVVNYGKDASGNDIFYTDGQFIEGKSSSVTYTVVSGSGKVALYDELANLSLVNDVSSTFKNKILNNATAIKTFDLRENTKIGSYIRSIFNSDQFSNSPIDISWGYDSYTYYRGVSVSEGVYTRKGELLNQFLSSSKSDAMIDFEDYITSGFSRNGIICPNLLNLEFYFDDTESDLYTINRYVGLYVSRNDLSNVRMNGDFYYSFKDLSGNENYPKPSRNDVGYYYNNTSYEVGSTSGVRLFYENGDGFLPGSESVNLLNPNKLFYVTDKNDNFYSLKRVEGYGLTGYTDNKYTYGPYNFTTETFGTTGSTGATCGSLVLQNTKINLLNFTGSGDNKIATIKGEHAKEAGKSFVGIEFLQAYDKSNPLTFKFYWPNGSRNEGGKRYDIIKSGDFSSILIWTGGSYYSTGNSYYFNASTGTPQEIASAFSSVMDEVDNTTMDSGISNSSSITRVKNSGTYGNTSYSIAIFSDYDNFQINYKGNWDNTQTYYAGEITSYDGFYYKASATVNPSIDPDQSGQTSNTPNLSSYWILHNTFEYSGYVKINGVDVSEINGIVNFIGGTRTPNNRIIFSNVYSDQVKPGYFIKTTTGYSIVDSVNKYVDSAKLDPVTNKVIGFNDFSYRLVVNLKDVYSRVDLGSDRSFNVYSSASSYIGVYTFFDVKEFDFDFWSSNYGYSPTPETYKYYQLQSDTEGLIKPNVPYLVKKGQIEYSNIIYNEGDIFYGATGYTSFTVPDSSLNLQVSTSSLNGSTTASSNVVVFPAQYSNVTYNSSATSYSNVEYSSDLSSFNGFLGIQGVLLNPQPNNPTKEQIFNYGKLENEYEYLKENYTTTRANISRIVPYINKWGSSIGTDARGNKYRLNSSPAFSPTNFSPSFDRSTPDPKYLTHEWMLLEKPPRDFPKSSMNDQNSYLASKIDLDLAKSCDPDDSLYLSSYFTVEPDDYDLEFRDLSYYTKELFTPLVYNEASGFYETIFRGSKVVLKKRSDSPFTGSVESDRYVPRYRGYEGYKFAAILRVIPEDTTTIQAPVKYQVIENTEQKFVLFVCDVVIKDQKAFPLGYTGGTGGSPQLDYTLLYLLNDKEKLTYPLASSFKFSSLDDIKLSCSLDLSLASGSYVNTIALPGRINAYLNPEYDSDLREEVHLTYVPNAPGATSGPSPTGNGSFFVPSISSTYPWPIGVGPDFIEFGKVVNPGTGPVAPYTFNIPFSVSGANFTVPFGPSSVYKSATVFQKGGGEKYYKAILSRCSLSYIANKVNLKSPYIKYRTYDWDSTNLQTVEYADNFELYFENPTRVTKPLGSYVSKSYNGPQLLKGAKVETSYVITQQIPQNSSILTRYSGQYEPLFRKVLQFDRDKTDTIIGDSTIDLSFRNCNFAPDKKYFGISRNLSYTKVSQGSNILSAASNYPEGPVYPLIGLTPIDKKDFNIFSSSWDPGYYDRYTTATQASPVAGTRSMKEQKTFFGSKVMKTPDPVNANTYITLQISRTQGISNVSTINSEIYSYIQPIQNITKSNSATGIGSVGPYLSGVDFDKIDMSIFPNAEIFWQYFQDQNKIKGTIRLDRILRRTLLNAGVKSVFIDNMISEFGYGDPSSIDDDVNNYIDLNINPLYQGETFNLYVKKSANTIIPIDQAVVGDLFSSDRYKLEYFPDVNYKLIRKSDLVYQFEYTTEKGFYYSLNFNFVISKI